MTSWCHKELRVLFNNQFAYACQIMKKKFLILISIFGLLLVLGATVVIFNIDQAISNLDDLVVRYQKERKCSKILMAIKEVQQDGFLHHTYDHVDLTRMHQHITRMETIITSCSSCHHPQEIKQKIEVLTGKASDFKQALTLPFTGEQLS